MKIDQARSDGKLLVYNVAKEKKENVSMEDSKNVDCLPNRYKRGMKSANKDWLSIVQRVSLVAVFLTIREDGEDVLMTCTITEDIALNATGS